MSNVKRILLIGNDTVFRPVLEQLPGWDVEAVADLREALCLLGGTRVTAVVAAFPMGAWIPAEVLEEILRLDRGVPVIVIDPGATLPDAVRLSRLGACQVSDGNAPHGELIETLETAAEQYGMPASNSGERWRDLLVGASRAMEDVAGVIRLIGRRRSTVLITGETGTGKEMVARALHMASPRAHLPLVAVCCSALPDHLLEAELFGHVKGAFTGAVGNRVGRFEQAHGSTLFLDEIGDMPLELQAKLLRVLQEREFQKLGSSENVRVDVRIVAATNVNLGERVRQGRFRQDLYYRLNVVPVHLPPLRNRVRDIPLLAGHFIEKICRAEGIPPKRVAREALDRLMRQNWPGNVRQLENAVEMALALSGERPVLTINDFPLTPEDGACSVPARNTPYIAIPDDGLDFERTVSGIERSLLEQALRRTRGNKTMAADMLRLKRTTLAAKLRTFEDLWSPAGVAAGTVQ